MKNRYSFSSVGPGFDLKRELLGRFPFIEHSNAATLPFDVMAAQLLANAELTHHQIQRSLRDVASRRPLLFADELRSLDRFVNLSRLGPQYFVNHPESVVLNLTEMCGQLLIWQILFIQSESEQGCNVRFLNNVFKALDSLSQEDLQKLASCDELPFKSVILHLFTTVERFYLHNNNQKTNLPTKALPFEPTSVPFSKLTVLPGWILLAHPSLRTLAYLTSFIEAGYLPASIIWMGWSRTDTDDCLTLKLDKDLVSDWRQFCYKQFFSLFEGFDLSRLPVDQHHVASSDINDRQLRHQLEAMDAEVLVFSGGGIVKSDTFSATSGRWLHCHPGDLPDYRGSTCFYYSYLNEQRLDCCAFWMSEQLDDGKIVEKTAFHINYPLQNVERYFIDYVLDPHMRRLTLLEVLRKVSGTTSLKHNVVSGEQSGAGWPYYVIHPYLRGLCASRMQSDFIAEKEHGIYKITPPSIGK